MAWSIGLVVAGQFLIVGMSVYDYMRATTPQAGQTWGALNARIVAHESYLMFGLALAAAWITLVLKRAES
jgi:hypothetical protein